MLTDRKARLVRTRLPLLSVSFDLDDSSTISNKRANEPTSALNAGLVGKFSFRLTQTVYIPQAQLRRTNKSAGAYELIPVQINAKMTFIE